MILTRTARIPWAWVLWMSLPVGVFAFVEKCSGTALIFTMRKFIADPALISLLGSVIGGLVIQATQTSMYAIGVAASAITAVKAAMVIVVILLYSQQVQDLGRKVIGRFGRRQAAA